MRSSQQSDHRILGIAPSKKGFGFAVIEARGLLVSWGVGRLYSWKREEFLQRLDALFDRYEITLLCLEGPTDYSKLGQRRRRLFELGCRLAKHRAIDVSQISRVELSSQLGLDQRASRHTTAIRVAGLFPELAELLPPPRRPWQTEDPRIALFMAVALGAAHLQSIRESAVRNLGRNCH